MVLIAEGVIGLIAELAYGYHVLKLSLCHGDEGEIGRWLADFNYLLSLFISMAIRYQCVTKTTENLHP